MRYVERDLTREKTLRSRELRKRGSVVEQIVWQHLRRNQLGFSFRRQHAIGPYVVDFYCHEAGLAVEFDGEQHDSNADALRDAHLLDKGVMTYRIPNRKFFQLDPDNTDWIGNMIRVCEQRAGRPAFSPPPAPPHPEMERGV